MAYYILHLRTECDGEKQVKRESMNLFAEHNEQVAIERIRKFARIAKAMELEIAVGFSGGKDSQVVYDLVKRSGVEFKVHFNHAFEHPETLRFIKEYYPEVIWRRDYQYGFIENIRVVHKGFLPTTVAAYCCENYKHNPKFVDPCAITGVRKAESQKRKTRTAFEAKNKTILKKNKEIIDSYFEEHCQSTGTQGLIHLKPIIDWSDEDVWDYIKRHNLPVNPQYKESKRVGCMVCPKANFTSNYKTLLRYPKLIDAFILAREKGGAYEWDIQCENRDCSNDKPYYICRWLNHSFSPFTKKQEEYYRMVREAYDKLDNHYKG